MQKKVHANTTNVQNLPLNTTPSILQQYCTYWICCHISASQLHVLRQASTTCRQTLWHCCAKMDVSILTVKYTVCICYFQLSPLSMYITWNTTTPYWNAGKTAIQPSSHATDVYVRRKTTACISCMSNTIVPARQGKYLRRRPTHRLWHAWPMHLHIIAYSQSSYTRQRATSGERARKLHT